MPLPRIRTLSASARKNENKKHCGLVSHGNISARIDSLAVASFGYIASVISTNSFMSSEQQKWGKKQSVLHRGHDPSLPFPF